MSELDDEPGAPEREPGDRLERPARLVAIVTACMSGGLVLIGLAALGATGSL